MLLYMLYTVVDMYCTKIHLHVRLGYNTLLEAEPQNPLGWLLIGEVYLNQEQLR